MDIEIEEEKATKSLQQENNYLSVNKSRDDDFNFQKGDSSFNLDKSGFTGSVNIQPDLNRDSHPASRTSINESQFTKDIPDSEMYEQGRADSVMSVLSEVGSQKVRTFEVNRRNNERKKCCGLSRIVPMYIDNKIVTSKYNFLTFLPLNLFLQFSKFANLYFLILVIMECFPLISDSNGVPVLAFPLCFVVGLSMIKDIYEDYIRHQSDDEENNRNVKVSDHTQQIFAPGIEPF